MRALLPLLALAAGLAGPASAVTIDWVPVGAPGNACDPQPQGCFGAVPYTYQISKYEVTNAQYVEFLNAVDPAGANALGLYNASMGSDAGYGGIDLAAGNPAGSRYVVKSGFAAKPVNYVSLFDGMRMANWLQNGQGGGDTENGAYTLLGGTPSPSNGTSVTRNAGAAIVLPSEDEWFKAAYYDALAAVYYHYPTGTDATTACVLPAADAGNAANCDLLGRHPLTDVGAYALSPSPNGTFDQGGNVAEWIETIYSLGRVNRGGSYFFDARLLEASWHSIPPPGVEGPNLGFRLVSLVPEPGAALLVVVGLLGAAGVRTRRG